jgi:hypothetical protein
MGLQVTKNAAVLEWKQLMLQAMQDAMQQLYVSEGKARLHVSVPTCLSTVLVSMC